jgi:hypothetical protein
MVQRARMSRETSQKRIHEAIQHETGEEVLAGWVLVTEWVSTSGRRRLRRLSGPTDLPEWQEAGYLHAALDPGWPTLGRSERSP